VHFNLGRVLSLQAWHVRAHTHLLLLACVCAACLRLRVGGDGRLSGALSARQRGSRVS